jgi:hypothetical protein
MIGNIPFKIPSEFASGIADGSIERFGTILKNASSGKILAHVQETGLAQSLFSQISASPFSPISSLSSIASNIQLAQIKSLVEGLQTLGFVTLGASVVGIGVSVSGFVLLSKKMNAIQHDLKDLSKKMDREFKKLYRREIRLHYSKVLGLIEQGEQAYFLKDPVSEWRRLSATLADESAFFRGEIVHQLEQESFDTSLFSNFIQSYSLCNSGRMQALLLSNELNSALKVQQDINAHQQSLFDNLTPSGLAIRTSPAPKELSRKYLSNLKNHRETMEQLLKGVRDAQDASITKAVLIQSLIEQEISGREYIEQLGEEKEWPFLLLAAA